MSPVQQLDTIFWLLSGTAFSCGALVGYAARDFQLLRSKTIFGCNESGDKAKDPRGCWNVRCQLGKVCCRPISARAVPGEPT